MRCFDALCFNYKRCLNARGELREVCSSLCPILLMTYRVRCAGISADIIHQETRSRTQLINGEIEGDLLFIHIHLNNRA